MSQWDFAQLNIQNNDDENDNNNNKSRENNKNRILYIESTTNRDIIIKLFTYAVTSSEQANKNVISIQPVWLYEWLFRYIFFSHQNKVRCWPTRWELVREREKEKCLVFQFYLSSSQSIDSECKKIANKWQFYDKRFDLIEREKKKSFFF